MGYSVTTSPVTLAGEPLTQLYLVAEEDRDAANMEISDLAVAGTEVASVNDQAIVLWGLQLGHYLNIST